MTTYNLDYLTEDSSKEIWKKTVEEGYKEEKVLYVKHVKNGYLLPKRKTKDKNPWMGKGGVLNAEKLWIEESGIYLHLNGADKIVFGGVYKISQEPTKKIHGSVIYMGNFFSHWGHFLLDFIPRLWYAVCEDTTSPIVYLIDNKEDEISGNYAEMIALMGLDLKRFVPIYEYTECEEIIIPQPGYQRGRYYSQRFLDMLDTVVKNASGLNLPCYDKLYFSRANFAKKSGKEFGYEEIDMALEANGYTIMYPEKLSTIEQVYYIGHCKEFVVAPGGSSMNALFIGPETRIVYLHRDKMLERNNDIFMIAHARKVKNVDNITIYFLPSEIAQLQQQRRDRFWVGITDELEAYLESRNMQIPEGMDKQKLREKIEQEQKEYCVRIQKEMQYVTQRKQRNELLEKAMEDNKDKELILFGAGHGGRVFLQVYGTERVAFFCDNNTEREGELVNNIKIISFSTLKEIYNDNYLVVVTVVKNDEIIKQLEEAGIKQYEIFHM